MSSTLATVERKHSVINWKKPPAEPDSVWPAIGRPDGVSRENGERDREREREVGEGDQEQCDGVTIRYKSCQTGCYNDNN